MVIEAGKSLSSRIKYLISALLIIAGALILFLSNYNKQSEASVELPDPIIPLSVSVDLKFLDYRLEELSTSQYANESKILPLMVVTTEICPPCVNNIDDYAELLTDHPRFFEPTLVFVDEEEPRVERFLLASAIEIPFEVLVKEETEPLFIESKQHIVFVNLDRQTVFHKANIPNVTTSLDYKNELLDDVSTMWKDLFAEDDKSKIEGSASTFC
jgi:hypothetical protein